jgi:hypothetical protein
LTGENDVFGKDRSEAKGKGVLAVIHNDYFWLGMFAAAGIVLILPTIIGLVRRVERMPESAGRNLLWSLLHRGNGSPTGDLPSVPGISCPAVHRYRPSGGDLSTGAGTLCTSRCTGMAR